MDACTNTNCPIIEIDLSSDMVSDSSMHRSIASEMAFDLAFVPFSARSGMGKQRQAQTEWTLPEPRKFLRSKRYLISSDEKSDETVRESCYLDDSTLFLSQYRSAVGQEIEKDEPGTWTCSHWERLECAANTAAVMLFHMVANN
jgi:hypothetical protein